MKTTKLIRRTIATVVVGLVTVGMMINFNGCSKESSPIGPENQIKEEYNSINFFKIGDVSNSLKKAITVSQRITRKDGGELKLDFIEDKNDNPLKILVSLVVEANTISRDATLTLTLDDRGYLVGNFDVKFGPSGIRFSQPATLFIKVENADLSDLTKKDLRIFYVNEQTRRWRRMPYKEIIVYEENGIVEVIEAKIPHFSRYAIACE